MGWSLLHKGYVVIAFLNPELQFSDAQFAAWYDLQSSREGCEVSCESQEQAAKQGLSYVQFSYVIDM